MKIKSYLMAAVGFGVLVGSIILAQPFVSHSQNEVPATRVVVTNLPLEVRSVDEAPPCCVPKQPFRKHITVYGLEEVTFVHSIIFAVPSGKRLVIENFSVIGYVLPGEDLRVGFTYGSPSFFDQMRQDFPVTFQLDRFVTSQQMRVYVDPGEKIQVFAERKPAHGLFQVDFSISGFLVDLP